MASVDPAGAPSRVKLIAAFAAIYVIWGSTYLAIKYAVETVPPFFMTGVRFLLAGVMLYGWSVLRERAGRSRARVTTAPAANGRRAWRDAFIVGALLIVGGTSLVGWAERDVPSGIASLVLATTPLFMVLLESAEARTRPAPRVLIGVVIGLAGLGILVAPSFSAGNAGVSLSGVGALVLSALLWSVGALYSRRAALPASPARSTGMQMIAGAMLSIVGGFMLGEHRELSISAITPASLLAVAYLVVAGALVGFTAYLWLMRVSTPSRVATHAYVNPVVAVLLGWAVAGESVTGWTMFAMAVIVAAVVVIVSASTPRAAARTRLAGRARAIIPAWRARATSRTRQLRSQST
ncbi:MAG TPA: EamA family transporter [Gemmatimonadaceae bacterium]|nr:EamA family transporter [Gemmatimonadaceae bacterium]